MTEDELRKALAYCASSHNMHGRCEVMGNSGIAVVRIRIEDECEPTHVGMFYDALRKLLPVTYELRIEYRNMVRESSGWTTGRTLEEIGKDFEQAYAMASAEEA